MIINIFILETKRICALGLGRKIKGFWTKTLVEHLWYKTFAKLSIVQGAIT